MSIKLIVKFVVFLTSLLKKVPIILKKFWDFYRGKWGLFLVEKFYFGCGALGLGLGPALILEVSFHLLNLLSMTH